MIDIVIPLGSGSTWENNELRYSLRSIEMYLLNYNDIYIVCSKEELPDWLQNVKHIEYRETGHASFNILQKLLKFCSGETGTERFMAWNDDFFLRHAVNAEYYPNFHNGDLKASISNDNNWYNGYLMDTRKELQALYPTMNYDIHVPITMYKPMLQHVANTYDFKNKRLLVKSMYANNWKVKGEYLADCKIKGADTLERIERKVIGRHIFSTGDNCLLDNYSGGNPMKRFLQKQYPNKSKYER